MTDSYDVVIVGLGAMGSAAAYQLSKTKKRVLGIDQFSPPHTLGSAHGDTRITRQAIGEGKQYTPLVLRANQIWQELEKRSGKNLFTTCGGLVFGPGGCATTQHGAPDFIQESITAAKEYGIEHELLNCSDLKRRFPQFIYQGDEIGYYEPGAGFLRPEQCIATQLELARQDGIELRTDEQVLSLHPGRSGDSTQIETSRGSYTAETVIISAGAWVKMFLPNELHSKFQVFRQVLFWFEPAESIEDFAPGTFPVYIRVGERTEDMFYGFPAIDGIKGGVKLAAELFESTCDPDKIERTVTQEEVTAMFEHAGKYLKITSSCVRSAACLYTNTEDYDFVIDRLPDHPQVILASPCSGHGFKHSAAIGEILAEIATKGSSSLDITPFSLSRLY